MTIDEPRRTGDGAPDRKIDRPETDALTEEDLDRVRGGTMKTRHDTAKNARLQPSPPGLQYNDNPQNY